MNRYVSPHFIILLFLGLSAVHADSQSTRHAGCRSYETLSELPVRQSPKRVLLVPLLSRDPYLNQSDTWPERPASILASFYRKKYHADILMMKSVRSWKEYYLQADMLRNVQPFDRVIFISHGGFDGPVLKNSEYWYGFSVSSGKGELLQFSEAQPGLKNVVKITYHVGNNQRFGDYMEGHWQELGELPFDELRERLKTADRLFQPLNQDCYSSYCSAEKLATSPPNLIPYRQEICQTVCRKVMYELKNYAELSPERLARFADSLRALTDKNSLIFFGTCNPGSKAPVKDPEIQETDYLIDTPLFGGPYQSYVHLMNAATGRVTAGPVGNSSAEDVINRVEMFENNHPQRFLCIAEYSKK